MHAFHHAEDSGNFGRKSNGKVRFGFFIPEYTGPSLEVVPDLDRRLDQNLPLYFNKPEEWLLPSFIPFPNSLHEWREFGKGIQYGKSHFSCLAWFNWKMPLYFPRVVTVVSDRLSGIMTDLFWLSVRTNFTLASQAATVDLCGFDEISENYPVSFVFSSLNP